MSESKFKSPKHLLIMGIVLALIPLAFDNENLLVVLRLIAFVLFFYAGHLLFKRKNT